MGIYIEADTGSRTSDILDGLREKGSYYATIIHGPLEDECFEDPEPYTDEVLCRQSVTVAELPHRVKDNFGWKRVYGNGVVRVSLQFPTVGGLTPIVPTAMERSALLAR